MWICFLFAGSVNKKSTGSNCKCISRHTSGQQYILSSYKYGHFFGTGNFFNLDSGVLKSWIRMNRKRSAYLVLYTIYVQYVSKRHWLKGSGTKTVLVWNFIDQNCIYKESLLLFVNLRTIIRFRGQVMQAGGGDSSLLSPDRELDTETSQRRYNLIESWIQR